MTDAQQEQTRCSNYLSECLAGDPVPGRGGPEELLDEGGDGARVRHRRKDRGGGEEGKSKSSTTGCPNYLKKKTDNPPS